jgi:hypothetical protein
LRPPPPPQHHHPQKPHTHTPSPPSQRTGSGDVTFATVDMLADAPSTPSMKSETVAAARSTLMSTWCQLPSLRANALQCMRTGCDEGGGGNREERSREVGHMGTRHAAGPKKQHNMCPRARTHTQQCAPRGARGGKRTERSVVYLFTLACLEPSAKLARMLPFDCKAIINPLLAAAGREAGGEDGGGRRRGRGRGGDGEGEGERRSWCLHGSHVPGACPNNSNGREGATAKHVHAQFLSLTRTGSEVEIRKLTNLPPQDTTHRSRGGWTRMNGCGWLCAEDRALHLTQLPPRNSAL